jgi:head-tail adaptor
VIASASKRNKLVTIERPTSDEAFDGAGSGSWATVGEEWMEVQDVLPSRGERQGEGITTATRPARVRMRYRTDIDASMRFVLGTRIMQVISGPAEIGNREGCEFMVEEYSPAGGGA